MSLVQKRISSKRETGDSIMRRRITNNGISLENLNRIKKVIKNRTHKRKCCGR